MNKNQFFYKYHNQEGEELIGSFNLNKVLRTFTSKDPEGFVVMLDDIHDEYKIVNVSTDPRKEKREARKVQVFTHVYMSVEDGERFKKIAEV